MAAHAVASPTDADVANVVVKALSQAGEPTNAESLWKQIPKSLRPRKKSAFFEFLERNAADGILWKFAPYRGNAERYSHQPLERYAKQLVVAAMGDKPIADGKLKKSISKRLGSPQEHELQAILDRLVADGSLNKLPAKRPFKTVQYISTTTALSGFFAKPVKRFRDSIEEIAGVMTEARIPRDAILKTVREMLADWLGGGPAPVSDRPATFEDQSASEAQRHSPAAQDDGADDDRILEAIAELRDASRSPLVSVAKLRRALDLYFADNAAFDRAILSLSRQGKVALHHHDYPFGLPADERDALVTDGHKFFSEISVRP